MRSKPPPKRATPATCSSTSPTTYADSARIRQNRSCRISCAAISSRTPRLELAVNIESLEFPVDGLAQAVITVTTVELTDPGP